MTTALSPLEMAQEITAAFPDAVVEVSNQAVVVKGESLFKVAEYLKNDPKLAFNYLNDIAATDYYDYFEVVYRLTSIEKNHTLALKVRCDDRETPELPSVTSLWQGADFMEREVFDLVGINFTGHPNMKRIVLWEGFAGHPLRKDYL
jgi:NADH-quinone oxidoreductase subunit C